MHQFQSLDRWLDALFGLRLCLADKAAYNDTLTQILNELTTYPDENRGAAKAGKRRSAPAFAARSQPFQQWHRAKSTPVSDSLLQPKQAYQESTLPRGDRRLAGIGQNERRTLDDFRLRQLAYTLPPQVGQSASQPIFDLHPLANNAQVSNPIAEEIGWQNGMPYDHPDWLQQVAKRVIRQLTNRTGVTQQRTTELLEADRTGHNQGRKAASTMLGSATGSAQVSRLPALPIDGETAPITLLIRWARYGGNGERNAAANQSNRATAFVDSEFEAPVGSSTAHQTESVVEAAHENSRSASPMDSSFPNNPSQRLASPHMFFNDVLQQMTETAYSGTNGARPVNHHNMLPAGSHPLPGISPADGESLEALAEGIRRILQDEARRSGIDV